MANWSSNPSSINFQLQIPNGSFSPIEVLHTYKSPNSILSYENYLSFFVRTTKTAPWLQIDGIVQDEFIDEFGGSRSLTYNIINNNLSLGEYLTFVKFELFGVDQWGHNVLLSIYKFTVNLLVSEVNQIPELLNWEINFEEYGYLPVSYEIDLTSPFELKIPEAFNLQSTPQGVNVTIENGYRIYTGNSDAILVIVPTNTISQLLQGTYDYTAYINQNGQLQTLTIQVNVSEFYEIFQLSENTLYFEAIQFQTEPETKIITLQTDFNFDIQNIPDWITVTPTNGLPGTHNIEFTPQNAVELTPGVYSHTIHILHDGESDNIYITYNVIGMVVTPFNVNDFAYTLDVNFFEFLSNTPDTYFSVKMLAKIYTHFSGIETIRELEYKIPLFQNFQKKNFGRIIDRLMSEISIFQENFIQYKPANISFTIEHVNRVNENVLNVFYLNNIKYVAGITPVEKIGNMALLNINPSYTRVTPKSFQYFNFIVPFGVYSLNTYKNGQVIANETISTGTNNIFSKKITFNNHTPGDVIKIELSNGTNSIKKEYLIFPEGKYSNQIVWIDEYKLLQTLEFTGDFYIDNQIFNNANQVHKNLLSYYEKLDASREAQLYINTGWISKSDKVTINSLFQRKKAWLIIDNQVIELVPILNKIRSVDSEEDVIDYDTQFIINFKDNAQTYTF